MTLPKTNLRQVYHVACTLGEVVNGKLETRLSKLCQSSKINMWAKYKPVRYNFTNNRPTEWWKAQSGNCGINIPSATSNFDNILDLKYTYEPPRGDAYNEPFRLGDFAGYDPDAQPQYTIGFPEYIYNREMNYIRIHESGYSDTALELKDILGFTVQDLYLIAMLEVNSTSYKGTLYATTQEPFSEGNLGNMSIPLDFSRYALDWFLNGTTTITVGICNFKLTGVTSNLPTVPPPLYYPLPYKDIDEVRRVVTNTGASQVLSYGVVIKGGNNSDGIQFTLISRSQIKGTFTVINRNEEGLRRPFNAQDATYSLSIEYASGRTAGYSHAKFYELNPDEPHLLEYLEEKTFSFWLLIDNQYEDSFTFDFRVEQEYDGVIRQIGAKQGSYSI